MWHTRISRTHPGSTRLGTGCPVQFTSVPFAQTGSAGADTTPPSRNVEKSRIQTPSHAANAFPPVVSMNAVMYSIAGAGFEGSYILTKAASIDAASSTMLACAARTNQTNHITSMSNQTKSQEIKPNQIKPNHRK